jgi:phenylalanyl-tRNA synthetase beta chain
MKLSYEWLKEYVDTGLGVDDIANGLTMSGSEVGAIHKTGADSVMELEITSNRPDCLSVIGLAREVGAVFNKDLKLPGTAAAKEARSGFKIECVIENEQLCPLYTARVIKNVKIKPSSPYLAARVDGVGLRLVNNVVDVTNYCLMECGQPLHAFDLDKIRGGKVIVRAAKKGEKIVAIDGTERELDGTMLVIADAERPIAIAGVMGGRDTEVTESTKNILLESAYFDPLSVRRTARKLALHSDSSYRFERGIDKAMVSGSSLRAAGLIVKETGGELSELYTAGGCSDPERCAGFDVKKCSRILGAEIDPEWAKNVLKKLGFGVKDGGAGVWKLTIPTFREDIQREIDVVEEIARIYGYDRIPATIPDFIENPVRKEPERIIKDKIRCLLKGMGLNEIMTYSLISESAADKYPSITNNKVVLMNPLSEEQRTLTPQLIDGMLKTMAWNLNRKNSDLSFFELGKVYEKVPAGYAEHETLSLGYTGKTRCNWLEKGREVSYYDLKGVIENFFAGLKIPVTFSTCELEGFVSPSAMSVSGVACGFLAKAGRRLLKGYDIDQDIFVAQIRLDEIIARADLRNRYVQTPKYQLSARDVSVLCDKSLEAGEVLDLIKAAGGAELKHAELADVYEGDKLPPGKRSLMFSLKYGMSDRTMRDEEVEAIHDKIKSVLAGKLKVSFR